MVKNYPYTLDKDGQVHLSWIKRADYEPVWKHVEWMGEQPPGE